MNFSKKILMLLTFSVFSLHANFIEDLNKSDCKKYLTKNYDDIVYQSVSKDNADISPMCLNLKYYLEIADKTNNVSKYINLQQAQRILNKMKQFEVNMKAIQKSIISSVNIRNEVLIDLGYVKKHKNKVVHYEITEKSNNTYLYTIYTYSDRGIQTIEELLSRNTFIEQYPKLASSYVSIPSEPKTVDKNENYIHITSKSKVNKARNTLHYTITKKTMCRKFPFKSGSLVKKLTTLSTPEAIMDNDNQIIENNGYILVKTGNKMCWAYKKYMYPQSD